MQTAIKILGFLRKPARNKGRILDTYLRLLIQRMLDGNRQEANIFGKTMHFKDFRTFIFLYEEIFLGQHYRFQSDSSRPRIIDAGANIGMTALYFKTLYPEAEIVCFEPDPENFGFLEKNVTGNGLKNVTLHQVALGEKAGTLTLYGDNISASVDTRAPAGGQGVKVPADVLSKYLDEPADLLKMDIEGAEGTVLKEAADSLSKVKQIALEFHQFHDTTRLPEILTVFEQAGHRYDVTHWTKNQDDPDIFYCLIYTVRR